MRCVTYSCNEIKENDKPLSSVWGVLGGKCVKGWDVLGVGCVRETGLQRIASGGLITID